LALALPVVALCLLSLVQVAFLGLQRVLVVHAAREGARIAATGASPDRVEARVRGAASLDADRFSVETVTVGELVTVTVTYQSTTEVPVVGRMISAPDFVESFTMRLEAPERGTSVGG